jgi:hypothetical protein
MTITVAVLGSTGTLGSSVVRKLSEYSEFNVISVVRDRASNEGECYWDYSLPVPDDVLNANVVVNCARSISFSENIRITKVLCDELPDSTLFLNISSNCVSASPRSLFSKLLYKGDAYVREKRVLEKITLNRPDAIVLRPTIVPDEGGWRRFLQECTLATIINCPFDVQDSMVDISTRKFVGEEILRIILMEKPPSIVDIVEKTISVRDFIQGPFTVNSCSNTFYDSFLKNVIASALCSILLPDCVAFKIQERLQRRIKSDSRETPTSEIFIDGMTRLYLFGGHTLRRGGYRSE